MLSGFRVYERCYEGLASPWGVMRVWGYMG